jgi:anion-transporting  ArsA/GET3 family ATPase
MSTLLFPQVQFVVGKGGVGKTTLSAALALHAVRQGRRVLLVEMEPGGRVAAFLRMSEPPTYTARQSPCGVWAMAVEGRASLEEYLSLIVPVRRVLSTVFHSKIYQYFVAAAPGLKELMAVGKVWFEAERVREDGEHAWDVIVVDAPATGHSLQYLRMPGAARETFGRGLVRREAARVEAFLRDPKRTAIHLVTTAEEMPVTETIETYAALANDLRLPPGFLAVNRVHRGSAPSAAVEQLRRGGATLAGPEAQIVEEVARRATEENGWAAINRAQIERLHAAVPLPTLVLPMVLTEEFGAGDVARLSELLEAQWSARGGGAPRRSVERRA